MTIALGPDARILVIALRRLGDVLLTTPLIRSLKRAYPHARVDALVFDGTQGILQGNPDLSSVLVMPARPTMRESFALVRELWRRYDLAISTQTGDRPTLFAWAAGRARAGLADDKRGVARALKRAMLGRSIAPASGQHRVSDLLRLTDLVGVPAVPELVPPAGVVADQPNGPYAVIHALPNYRYKRWTEEGWRALAAAFGARGLTVVATGGPADEDRRYLDTLWKPHPEVQRVDGKLSWPELAALIGAAKVYVGPDTSVTHLAAATGVPTIALYGPTDPRIWGPWTADSRPWAAAGTVQRRGNVWLVQNPLPCLPCQQEGCERRIDSYSRCLDELSVQQVLAAADEALGEGRRSGSVPA